MSPFDFFLTASAFTSVLFHLEDNQSSFPCVYTISDKLTLPKSLILIHFVLFFFSKVECDLCHSCISLCVCEVLEMEWTCALSVNTRKHLLTLKTPDSKRRHERRQTGQLLYHCYIIWRFACCVCGLPADQELNLRDLHSALCASNTDTLHWQHPQMKYRR